MAQRRPAGRGGLRGDRPRPAGPRRERRRPRRPLRHRHLQPRRRGPGPRRARPRALRRRRRRRRRGGGLRPRPAGARASSRASATSTPAPPFLIEEYQAAGISLTRLRRRRRPARDRLPAPPGLGPRRPRRRAGHARTPPPRTSPTSTATGSGAAAGSFTQADVDFMTEPWAEEDRLRAGWAVYQLGRGTRTSEEVPRLFETMPVPASCSTAPRTRSSPSSSSPAARSPSPTGWARWSSPAPGHFLQWERADVLNGLVAGLVLAVPLTAAAAAGRLLRARSAFLRPERDDSPELCRDRDPVEPVRQSAHLPPRAEQRRRRTR